MSFKFILLYINLAIVAANSPEVMQYVDVAKDLSVCPIYGCEACKQVNASKASVSVPQSFYSCTSCASGLFLSKYRETALAFEVDRNVCTPSCKDPEGTFEDVVNRQCVFLGPFC